MDITEKLLREATDYLATWAICKEGNRCKEIVDANNNYLSSIAEASPEAHPIESKESAAGRERDYCESCGYTDSHDPNCPRPREPAVPAPPAGVPDGMVLCNDGNYAVDIGEKSLTYGWLMQKNWNNWKTCRQATPEEIEHAKRHHKLLAEVKGSFVKGAPHAPQTSLPEVDWQKLDATYEASTSGEWTTHFMEHPDGHALAWFGGHYIDTDAPKVKGIRYKDARADADLCATMHNLYPSLRSLCQQQQERIKELEGKD